MFGTKIAHRTARGMAVGALILSLSATTLGGSANAAPLADDTQGCKVAAHARNDAVHALHKAFKAFTGDLKELARDARKFQHDSEKAGIVLTKDARDEVASAKQELKDIFTQAHEDLRAAAAADLGTACKDADEDDDNDAASTGAATATTTTSTSATDTSALDAKFKAIVDKAIADMQAVVDQAVTALTAVGVAVESKDTKDVSKVKKDLENAKADREKAKADLKAAKAADKLKSSDAPKARATDQPKAKSNDKSEDKSNDSDEGSRKGAFRD
jgi:hypothetical protein